MFALIFIKIHLLQFFQPHLMFIGKKNVLSMCEPIDCEIVLIHSVPRQCDSSLNILLNILALQKNSIPV